MERTDSMDVSVSGATDKTVQDAGWFFARLPSPVLDTLTSEHKTEIAKALLDPSWKRPPVNIRLSIPFFTRRFYITIVGGEEKRSAERRSRERSRYPLRTIANVFFFVGIATAFYIAVILGLAFQSAIVEF